MLRPIFCGNFEYDARQSELERLFRRYGRVERVDMKSGLSWQIHTHSWLMDGLIRILCPACDELPLLAIKKSHSDTLWQNFANFPESLLPFIPHAFPPPSISDMFSDRNIADLTAEAAE